MQSGEISARSALLEICPRTGETKLIYEVKRARPGRHRSTGRLRDHLQRGRRCETFLNGRQPHIQTSVTFTAVTYRSDRSRKAHKL